MPFILVQQGNSECARVNMLSKKTLEKQTRADIITFKILTNVLSMHFCKFITLAYMHCSIKAFFFHYYLMCSMFNENKNYISLKLNQTENHISYSQKSYLTEDS